MKSPYIHYPSHLFLKKECGRKVHRENLYANCVLGRRAEMLNKHTQFIMKRAESKKYGDNKRLQSGK